MDTSTQNGKGLAGLLNHYEFYNPLNNRHFSIRGWGVSLNAFLEIAPRLTLITTNYYSNGGGDYIFGEAPDLIIQATGAPSLLPSGSTVDGLEYNPTSKWEFWAYYGGTWIGRISTFDPVAVQPVGYGYIGSPDSQNRTIQEVTAGFHRTFWNNPNYGSFQFAGQCSWIVRHPWFVAPGSRLGQTQHGLSRLSIYLPGHRRRSEARSELIKSEVVRSNPNCQRSGANNGSESKSRKQRPSGPTSGLTL